MGIPAAAVSESAGLGPEQRWGPAQYHGRHRISRPFDHTDQRRLGWPKRASWSTTSTGLALLAT